MTDQTVAYLVSRYPGLSLTFIQREIEGLRTLGWQVSTFSVRRPHPEELLTDRMRQEAAQTPVLLSDRRLLAGMTLTLLRRHPMVYGRMLRLAARCGPPHPKGRLWQLFYLTEAVRLYEELSARGLRHVHVHFANNGADIARLVVALGRHVEGPHAGWRWTMTMHGPTELENVTEFDLARKLADADGVACISDFTRSQVMRLLPLRRWSKLAIVPMSVDTERFRTTDRLGRQGAVRILNVGRLVPEKGAPVLLESVRRLVDAGRDVLLRVVGGGLLANELSDQIERLGLAGKVEMMGPRGQDDLPALYEWADVFCLPSFQEGLPVVLMEAMASGLPVVTTSVAGIPELVDRTNGRVVTPGRADLLATALAEIADDAVLRDELGQAGRRRVERDFAVATAARAQASFLRG